MPLIQPAAIRGEFALLWTGANEMRVILTLVMVNSSFSLFDFGCWFVVFLISLSTHEAAHAFTAQKLGDVTGYLGGQVTLNPVPHIRREPWGMLIIPILSYISSEWMIGWASAHIILLGQNVILNALR